MMRSMARRRRRVTTGAAWSPLLASVPVRAWYRADLGVTAAGSAVSAVADQSGAGDANRNQTGAPTLNAVDAAYGGRSTISHVAQKLTSAGAWSASVAKPISLVFVGEASSGNKGVLGNTAAGEILWSSSGTWAFYNGGNLDSLVACTSPSVVLLTDDGTGGAAATKLYVNNLTTPAATSVTAFLSANGLDIGNGAGVVPNLTGKWAEVMVFAGVLTAGDVTSLRSYLNTTRAYGIAVT